MRAREVGPLELRAREIGPLEMRAYEGSPLEMRADEVRPPRDVRRRGLPSSRRAAKIKGPIIGPLGPRLCSLRRIITVRTAAISVALRHLSAAWTTRQCAQQGACEAALAVGVVSRCGVSYIEVGECFSASRALRELTCGRHRLPPAGPTPGSCRPCRRSTWRASMPTRSPLPETIDEVAPLPVPQASRSRWRSC